MRYKKNNKGLIVPDLELIDPGLCETLAVNQLIGFGGGGGGAAAGPGFLGDIEGIGLDATLFCCLDAGESGSYTSGQTWADQTANGIDWHLGSGSGSDGADPTFNGVAGTESNAEYFSYAGDAYMTCKTKPSLIDAFHKNNAVLTIACWLFVPSSGMNDSRVFSNNGVNATTTGFMFGTAGPGSTDDFSSMVTRSSSGSSMAQSTGVTLHVTTNAWNFVAVSIDEAAGGSASFWYKSRGSSVATTFDATYTSPASGASQHNARIGALGDSAGSRFPGGTRTAGVFFFSSSLTQANLDSIYTATNDARSFV